MCSRVDALWGGVGGCQIGELIISMYDSKQLLCGE
jgi:hypothetical protein